MKVDDTVPGIGEGVAAGTWTVGVTLTGNEVGLSAVELARLSEAERSAHRVRAGAVLRAAGADFLVGGIGELPTVVAEIDARLAAGKRPGGG